MNWFTNQLGETKFGCPGGNDDDGLTRILSRLIPPPPSPKSYPRSLYRNRYFLAGILLILLGIQFRMVQSFVLNEPTTRVLAKIGKDTQVASQSSMTDFLLQVHPNPTKRVTPPRWFGLSVDHRRSRDQLPRARDPAFARMMFLIPSVLWWARAPLLFGMGVWRRSIPPCMITLLTIHFSINVIPVMSASAQDGWAGEFSRDPTPRSGEGSWPLPGVPRIAENRTADPDRSEKLLREGAQITAVPGRIVSLGSRWSFVPDANGEMSAKSRINPDDSAASLFSAGSHADGNRSNDRPKTFEMKTHGGDRPLGEIVLHL